jgi:hypothetical protein
MGCGGGQDFLAYEWIMSAGGIPSEANYPYIMVNGECTFDSSLAATKVTSYVNVTAFDETALMDAVVTAGPISISIDASQDSLSFYSEGVYVEPACKVWCSSFMLDVWRLVLGVRICALHGARNSPGS